MERNRRWKAESDGKECTSKNSFTILFCTTLNRQKQKWTKVLASCVFKG